MNFPRTDGESGDLQIGFTRKGDLLTFDGANDFTLPVGANNYVLTADSSQTAGLSWKPTGGGSVSGPISSTLNAIARYTDTSGKVIKNSGVTITDANVLMVPNSVITNTLRSTDNVPLDVSSGTTGDLTLGVYATTGNIRPYRPFVASGASLSTLDLNSSVLTMSPASTQAILNGKLRTDTTNRISIDVSNGLLFGGGVAAAIDTRLYRTAVNTLTLDNNADGAATLASTGGALLNFATITRAGALAITTSSGNGSISYTTNGSGDHIFKSTTGNVQINRPITTSAGDLTLNPTGSNVNFSSKNLTSVNSVVVSSSATSYNALDLNAPPTNTGTGSGPRIALGATFSASGDEPSTIKLLLYPNYGFAIGGAGLNSIVPGGSYHRFYCADAAGSTPVMVLNSSSVTTNQTLNARTTNSVGVVITSGTTTATGSATPNAIDLRGSFYNSTATDIAALKLRIFNDGTSAMGLGITTNQFNYVANNASFNHVFYVDTVERMRISSSGVSVRGVVPRCLATSSNTYNGSVTTEQSVNLTVVSGSLTINAGQIQIGSTIKVLAKFNTTNATSGNINVRLKSATTTIYHNTITPNFTGNGEITFKIYQSTPFNYFNTVVEGSRWYSSTGYNIDNGTSPVTIDWAIANTLSLTVQFTAGSNVGDTISITRVTVGADF